MREKSKRRRNFKRTCNELGGEYGTIGAGRTEDFKCELDDGRVSIGETGRKDLFQVRMDIETSEGRSVRTRFYTNDLGASFDQFSGDITTDWGSVRFGD